MSFPRYPEYKDSGVEWLGEVPGHWATPPLYLRYSVELGKMLDSSRITGDHLVPYLRNVDVQWGRINFDDLPEMDIEESEYGRYTVAPGDLLVCEGGEVGRAAIVPERSGTIGFQKALHRLRALADDEHPAFMYFVLSWAALRGVFSQSGLSTIAHLTGEQLRKYRFPKPPIPEQVQIAAFLDRETAKIDALVAEQQNLIALLKEKRQALISHAVTKGLDPDVPMKDSGVAWLGEVPAHWGVSALGYLATIETGATPDRAEPRYWNGSIPWLKTGEINWAPIREAEEFITEEGVANTAVRVAKPGMLLMAMYGQGATRGRVARLEIEATYNQACAAILFGDRLLPEFGRYFFMAAYEHVRDGGNETSQMNLSAGLIAKIRLPVPRIDEQVAVVLFLDSEIANLDGLTAEAERAIAFLQERRTALISAAVTGKIDVRHLAVVPADRTPEPA